MTLWCRACGRLPLERNHLYLRLKAASRLKFIDVLEAEAFRERPEHVPYSCTRVAAPSSLVVPKVSGLRGWE